MKLTTFSKSRTKFDNSSAFPTKGDKRRNSFVAFFLTYHFYLYKHKKNVQKMHKCIIMYTFVT